MRIPLFCYLLAALLFACRHERTNGGSANQHAGEWGLPADSKALYFPLSQHLLDTASHEQALDSFTGKFYSSVLFNLQAPILFGYNGPEEVYRFTLIPMLINHPVSIAISRQTDGFRLAVKAYRRPGHGHPEPTVLDTTLTVGPEEWNGFQDQLSKIRFWTLAAETYDEGDDGSDWILEGTRNGTYHFADRWTPGQGRYQAFHDCCNYLYLLAKKKVMEDEFLPYVL